VFVVGPTGRLGGGGRVVVVVEGEGRGSGAWKVAVLTYFTEGT
jgi:hypothetical protein